MKKFRVLFTGGGTGGHIFPIVAVATELQLLAAKQNFNCKIKYVGAPENFKDVLDENGIAVKKITSSKIRRYFSIANFFEGPRLLVAFIEALWHVYWFMPDVLFSKGGTSVLPVVLAARFYRIPVIIHESDAVPGASNLISSKFAKVICGSFEGIKKYLGPNVKIFGNPVRRKLLDIKFTKDQVKRRLGFDPTRPLIFVYGGSQGSVRINNFIIKNLPLILEVSQVFHQTGKENYEQVLLDVTKSLAEAPEELKEGYKAIGFLNSEEEVQAAYLASDLVVSRAGASNIFEIAAFGKPAILIPLPESAQDHQRANAYEYESLGAGIVVEEENLLPNLFLNKLIDILSDPQKMQSMSDSGRRFFKPKAALNLAEILLEFKR